ncbi:MAG: YdcF family protein [Chitinispirillales bacterium]|jgi:uncharacterized SAM-binding protein YcdF (DUF218 family)|nr:YdcF family protein [Chitinispirillales bacterium]
MSVILSKLLVTFINPVGLTLLFLACGMLFTFVWRKARLSAVFFVGGFALLLAFSLPVTAHFLMRGLEGRYEPRAEYEPASAVVLLGGFTRGRVPPRLYVETNIDANRAFGAMRVWKRGSASKIVLTGGLLEWTTSGEVTEAGCMFDLLNEHFGVDSADVLFESMARNTRDNARYTREALTAAGLGLDIILVTSAYHMPRSVAVFEKAGFTVTPAPVGYFSDNNFSVKPLMWLPGTAPIFESSIALREYLGMTVYRALGWI